LDNSNPVLTGGLLCAGVILFLLIMTPVIVALELRRLRRARARFLEGRQVLSDAAFLSRAAVAVDRGAFFLAARRAMAQLSCVPAEMVYPEDTWRSLMDLQWDNGFLEDIVFALERELCTNLPLAYPLDDRLSCAAFIGQLALCLERASENPAEPQSAHVF
jgi:hypothetical protein